MSTSSTSLINPYVLSDRGRPVEMFLSNVKVPFLISPIQRFTVRKHLFKFFEQLDCRLVQFKSGVHVRTKVYVTKIHDVQRKAILGF